MAAIVLTLEDLRRLGWGPALVPTRPGTKKPGIAVNGSDAFGWQTRPWSPAELDAAEVAGCSFGIRFGIADLPCAAIDCDAENETADAAPVVEEVVRRVVGEGGVKRGREGVPRFVLLFRTATCGDGKDVVRFARGDTDFSLEVFTGPGCQIVAGPKHETGVHYIWDTAPAYAALPVVVVDVALLFRELEKALKPLGFKLVGTAHTTTAGDALERDPGKRADDPLWKGLAEQRLVMFAMRDGWAAIKCPFESEHSGKRARRDSSSVYMPPAIGTATGFVRCLHAHCSGRTQAEFAEALGVELPPDFVLEFPKAAPESALAEIRPTGGREPPAPMAAAAYHGLFGEAVELMAAACEASRENLLMHSLVAFSAVPDRAGVAVGSAQPAGTALQALIVGDTARARKGTAARMAMNLLGRAFPGFVFGITAGEDLVMPGPPRVLAGISSGEGLIYAIRDPSGNPEDKAYDPGISDKRLLLRIEEFSLLLKVAAREGNTLSEILRGMHDGGALAIPTRRDPLFVSRAHIACFAHVTKAELEHRLEGIEVTNGMLNRWLLVHVARGRVDAQPPPLDEERANALALQFRKRLTPYTTVPRELALSPEAQALWNDELYAMLDSVGGGVIGEALAARFPSYCKRIALLYAITANAKAISIAHLRAAAAVLDYCERSIAYIFGTAAQTDPIVQRVSDTIKEAGGAFVPRALLWKALQRNVASWQIDDAIAELYRRGQIHITAGPPGPNGKKPVFYAWIGA